MWRGYSGTGTALWLRLANIHDVNTENRTPKRIWSGGTIHTADSVMSLIKFMIADSLSTWQCFHC